MVHLITHGTNAELFLQKESKRKEMEATTLQLFKEKHAFLSQRQLFFFNVVVITAMTLLCSVSLHFMSELEISMSLFFFDNPTLI